MNCSDCKKHMFEFLSYSSPDDAPETLTSQIFHHVAACADCREELGEGISAFGAIPLGLTPVTPPADFEQRVLDRISRGTAKRDDTPLPNPSVVSAVAETTRPPAKLALSGRKRWLSYGLAAAILLTVVTGEWYYLRQIATVARASRDPSEEERIQSLEQAVAELRRLQQQSANTRLQFVSIDKERASAQGVWDVSSSELHFHGFGLGQPPAGLVYAVWLVTEDMTHLATTFRPERDGSVAFVAPVSGIDAGHRNVDIVVTLESNPVGDTPSAEEWARAQFTIDNGAIGSK